MTRINHNLNGLNLPVRSESVFIGIPTYDGKPTTQCFSSVTKLMLLLQAMGIGSKLMFAKYNTFIDKARNELIDAFEKSECTHILMNDADQGFEAEKIILMLKKDKNFIAAAVRQKQLDETYAIKVNVNDNMTCKEDDGLISTHRIGMALALMKRELFENLKTYLNLPVTKNSGTHYTDAGIIQEKDGSWGWIGEDYDFCKKCTDAGEKIWIYPDINITHVGPYEFKNNFHEYLCKQPQPILTGGLKLPTI